MPDYRLELINQQAALTRAAEILSTRKVVALDIETIEWWNRQREKVALIQFAYRLGEQIKVIIVDALADCDIGLLRAPLESAETVKVIHNAAFDATKLLNHYQIQTIPIYDTMVAARRSGEKRYSLLSQAATHLNIHLNKTQQRSDWSRRPLDLKQIDYAARDVFATLLLYEHQTRRNLAGSYLVKENRKAAQHQPPLPLDDSGKANSVRLKTTSKHKQPAASAALNLDSDIVLQPPSRAILGIVSELPGRYGPEQLSVSVGIDRVGLAGWIIDRFLGRETDFDEETARLVIGDLCDRQLIRITERRLEATNDGNELWKKIK